VTIKDQTTFSSVSRLQLKRAAATAAAAAATTAATKITPIGQVNGSHMTANFLK